MTEKPNEKPKLELVDPPLSAEDQAALDQDELEYRRLRRDLPGVTGAAAQGIVSVSVSKAPTKNEFFRTHPTFRPEVPLVNIEVGMEKQFFAVDPCMEMPLHGIGISFTEHTSLPDDLTARRHPCHSDQLRDGQRIQPHQGDRTARRRQALGPALHRSGEQGVPGLSGTGRPVRRTAMAAAERSQDLPALLPRQGPDDRQHRARAVQEVGGP